MEAISMQPGRLGDPTMTLATDPRADRRMVSTLKANGLSDETPISSLGADADVDQIRAKITASEAGFDSLFELLNPEPLPRVEGVISRTEVISGIDGNDISLYIHRPNQSAEVTGALPCILHFHGGGMVMLSATDPTFTRWREVVAALDLVVIGVEFRNAAGRLGTHPFPAGLNDCTAALQWVYTNREDLNISKIVLSGESGGGNLTLATTLKARRDGHIHMIDGAYAMCPYISGAYDNPPEELPSLLENDGYFLSCEMMAPMVKCYDPDDANRTNPLAWPYHVSVEELRDLPPHVISVNELDPLRDEGLAYYRKLLAADVPTVGRTVNGTCHAADILMPGDMADVYAASASDLAAFAHNL